MGAARFYQVRRAGESTGRRQVHTKSRLPAEEARVSRPASPHRTPVQPDGNTQKKQYTGLNVSELRELKQLQHENHRLKAAVADLTLDEGILRDALGKQGEPSSASRGRAPGAGSLPRERAPGVPRAMRAPGRGALLLGQAGRRVRAPPTARAGARTVRRRRRGPAMVRHPRAAVARPNERWRRHSVAMGFMHGTLATSQAVRVSTLVDVYSRECIALKVARSFSGTDVVRLVSDAGERRGALAAISQCDDGPEFTSTALDHWAYWNRVQLDFVRPAKPVDNSVC